MSKWKEYLTSIYYDVNHPGSYAGPDKLYKVVKAEGTFKIGKYRVQKWLQSQETYSLTRGARRKFPRNRVIVSTINEQFDVDLADLTTLSKQNEGYKYLLVAIDIFSRYVWCYPLKFKEGEEVIKSFRHIISQGRIPSVIRTDKGKEFKNKKVSAYPANIVYRPDVGPI